MSAVSPHDARVLVTPTGYARLCSQLELLRSDGRRRVADRVAEARRDGELADNPALADALEEQAKLELRIADLELRVATARIVEKEFDGSAQLGCHVRLRDLGSGEVVAYELVGAFEADPDEGRLSAAAPVGEALLGLRPGAVAVVTTPTGPRRFELLSVGPGEDAGREKAA